MPPAKLVRRLLAALALSAVASSAVARERTVDEQIGELLGDAAAYRAVIGKLQKAIRGQDAGVVAELVDYPIGVRVGGPQRIIRDAAEFVARYDTIITPEIALAVQDEPYDDLFVNYQGVRLGNGEIWINGVCRDNACRKSDPRVVTIQDTEPPAARPQPGRLMRMRDWDVGCDNVLSCTAIGAPAGEISEQPAYVKVTRDGGAEDDPRIAFTIFADRDGGEASDLADPVISLATPDGGKPPPAMKAAAENGYYTGTIEGEAAHAAIAALLPGRKLEIRLLDGEKSVTATEVSLSGVSAALRYMDTEQRRTDSETALIARGPRPVAESAPSAALPVVRARMISEIADPPPLPASVQPDDESCSDVPGFAVRLSADLILQGACEFVGAYNLAYRLYMTGAGGARPLRIHPPRSAAQAEDMAGVLVNPGVDEGGRTLTAFNKGRGIGDCGEISTWAFDGATLKLAEYRALTDCRGVPPDDWPVLYRAKIENAD